MSKIATGLGSRVGGIILKQKKSDDILGIAFQDARSAAPTSSADFILYRRGSSLYVWDGSTETVIGGASAGGDTLDSAYNAGRTVTVDDGAVTLNGVDEDTAVLSITGDGDSGGALISLSHTTNTRNDILGTGSSWSVTGQGNATFNQIDLGDDDAIRFGATPDAQIKWVNASNHLDIEGATNFDGDMTLEAAHSLTIAGAGGADKLTVTAGDVVIADGSITLTDADNAASVVVVNNTATTVGAAAATGVVEFASTSLTTGTLLHLELTEGTLNGGHYLKCWDVTAGAAVFEVKENGDLTIAGTAGSNALDIVAGDARLQDGSLTLTDADNAATFSVTNNTATTASVVALAGSGAFTGSTSSSFFTITPSGLTTGTGIYAVAAAMTTGTLMHLVGSGATAQANSEVLLVDAGAATVGQAFSITNSGVYTGTGVFTLTANSATTGNIAVITANGLTTGSALLVTSSGTVTSSGEGVVNIVASGMTTGSALKIDLTEATLNGGFYINCYDDTATASVFSVGEDGAVIAGTVLYKHFTEDVTSANVITAAESGSVFFLNSATEFASTLPAPAAGLHFTFIVKAAPSGASYTITTNGSANIIKGTVHSSTGGDADSETSGADTINFVDGVAVAGDMVQVWCDGTNWFAKAFCDADGGVTITTAS